MRPNLEGTARRMLAPALLAAALTPGGLLLAAGRPGTAETPPSPAAAPSWEFSAVANGYLLPDEDDFVLGIVTADREQLHLEARYNYEDRHTTSVLAGWNFSGGEEWEWAVTPLLGAAAGDTDAILSGVEFSLEWKQFDYYLEAEAAFDLNDTDDNFTYGWSEIGWTPVDWLRVGFVAQRTRVVDTGVDIQRGIMAQGLVGRFTLGADWFNPGGDDEFVVAVLEVAF